MTKQQNTTYGDVLIIGDIHGRTNWQELTKTFDNFRHIVVMGDYFDPYQIVPFEEQVRNFETLLGYVDMYRVANLCPDGFIMLLGNHDYHYLKSAPFNERYSRYDAQHAEKIRELLEMALNNGYLRIAWNLPNTNIVFTHAGLSAHWVARHIIQDDDLDNNHEGLTIPFYQIPELIHQLNIAIYSRPEIFRFGDCPWDYYGYDSFNGPLWWRITSENQKDALGGIFQINGHTQTAMINRFNHVALVDTLGQGDAAMIRYPLYIAGNPDPVQVRFPNQFELTRLNINEYAKDSN